MDIEGIARQIERSVPGMRVRAVRLEGAGDF